LIDFRGRAPGQVILAGLGEQVIAGVFEAVGEIEARCVFGDQCTVPGALPLAGFAPRRVEGEGGRLEIADGPRPTASLETRRAQPKCSLLLPVLGNDCREPVSLRAAPILTALPTCARLPAVLGW